MSLRGKWKTWLAVGAALPAIAVSTPGLAQQTPLEYQEQKAALSSFHARYFAPLEACAVVDPQSLEKARWLVAAMRARYPRTFEVAERHPVFVTTVREAQAAAGRPRALSPAQVCARGIAALEAALGSPNAQQQYDRYMQYLIDLLS